MKNIFLDSAVKRFKEYKTLGDKTLAQLNDDEMLWQPNKAFSSLTYCG